jgi:hypothetical protein
MHFPYALQLAYGMTRLPLKINTILILAMIPTTTLLGLKYGAVGGAGAWAILNVVYLLIGTTLTHQSILKGVGVEWLLCDVGMPLGISILIVGGIGNKIRESGLSYPAELFMGSGLALCAFLIIVAISPGLRIAAQKLLTKK